MSIKDHISETTPKWYAVKCKFRCEKRLMEEFRNQGFECYVPIQEKVKLYTSKTKKSKVALIPSHIFVKIVRDEYIPILRHQHVYGFLNFSGVLNPIPDSEMDVMRRVVGEFKDASITQGDFSVGDVVDIIGGELTGLRGRLIGHGNYNLIIELESLGMGLTLNVEPEFLIKTETSRMAVA